MFAGRNPGEHAAAAKCGAVASWLAADPHHAVALESPTRTGSEHLKSASSPKLAADVQAVEAWLQPLPDGNRGPDLKYDATFLRTAEVSGGVQESRFAVAEFPDLY